MKMTTTGKFFAERIPNIKNCARISPHLYRSADPGPDELAALKSLGIKSILSFRSWTDEKGEVESCGLNAFRIPLEADIFGSKPPTEDQIRYFFYLIRDQKHQPVLFHCQHGADRTGVMCALYRVEVDGWSPEEAIEEMQYFGFHDNWIDLMKFIKNYKPRGF